MWRLSGIIDQGWASAQINQGYFFTTTGDCAEDSTVREILRLCLSLRCLAVKSLRPNCTREGEREGEAARLGGRGEGGGEVTKYTGERKEDHEGRGDCPPRASRERRTLPMHCLAL